MIEDTELNRHGMLARIKYLREQSEALTTVLLGVLHCPAMGEDEREDKTILAARAAAEVLAAYECKDDIVAYHL